MYSVLLSNYVFLCSCSISEEIISDMGVGLIGAGALMGGPLGAVAAVVSFFSKTVRTASSSLS